MPRKSRFPEITAWGQTNKGREDVTPIIDLLPPTAVDARSQLAPELRDLVSQSRPAVCAHVARLLHRSLTDPEVEDCVHETLRRALEGQSRLQNGQPARPWLLGIARHVALDALRARQRDTARTEARFADSNEVVAPVEALASSHPNPETHAALRQQGERLHGLLQTLPPGQRDALLLFHMDGLSYQEIAQQLGVSLGTVGTWVLRARQRIAAAIASAGGNDAGGLDP